MSTREASSRPGTTNNTSSAPASTIGRRADAAHRFVAADLRSAAETVGRGVGKSAATGAGVISRRRRRLCFRSASVVSVAAGSSAVSSTRVILGDRHESRGADLGSGAWRAPPDDDARATLCLSRLRGCFSRRRCRVGHSDTGSVGGRGAAGRSESSNCCDRRSFNDCARACTASTATTKRRIAAPASGAQGWGGCGFS